MTSSRNDGLRAHAAIDGAACPDSSLVIAAVFREPGGDSLRELMPDALMCAVNVTEIVTRLYDKGWPIALAAAETAKLVGRVAPFDDALAFVAGRLRVETRELGLSLGDRACLALAMAADLPVYTADRDWGRLDLGLDIRLIR
jgi:PIN domain nuclease of toxin-antitoxin system